MKKTIILSSIFILAIKVNAQFTTTNGQTTTLDNVGIGTINPSAQLEVYRNLTFGSYKNSIPSHLTAYDASTNPEIPNLISGSTGGTLIEASGHGQFVVGIRDNGGDDGFHILSTSQTYTGQQNGLAAPYNKLIASFLANGKVGIGTNSPATNLDVRGNAAFKDGNIIDFAISTPDGKNGFILSPNEYGNYSRFDFINWDNSVLANRYFQLKFNQDASGLTIRKGGNVGIGTSTPSTQLEVSQSLSFGSYKSTIPSHLAGYDASTNPEIPNLVSGSAGGTLMEAGGYGQFVIGIRDNGGTDGFHILSTTQTYGGQQNGSAAPYNKLIASFLANGNVGIGTNSPDAKLTVKGDIHTREVKVDLNGAIAPDFVFDDGYKLRTLSETEKYLTINKHLPEIPSAAEMEENGFELKEMNLKLLQKIEELTLYLIEQNKQTQAQQAKIEQLEKKIAQLENE